MGTVAPYDRDAGVQLMKRALERSRMTIKDFAREELVRDERTVRMYLHGATIPRVVREKLQKLARRRPRTAEPIKDDASFEAGAVRALVALGYKKNDAARAVHAARQAGGRATSVPDLVRRALTIMA